ncbi:antitoxin, partial [Archaeoglobales archaeon]
PIEINPEISGGKPVIKGTRITVEFILELLANGWSYEEILENYPQLKKEDILEAINYAADVLKEERIYMPPKHEVRG